MSLTSYRAAPSRAGCQCFCIGLLIVIVERYVEVLLGLAVTYSPTS